MADAGRLVRAWRWLVGLVVGARRALARGLVWLGHGVAPEVVPEPPPKFLNRHVYGPVHTLERTGGRHPEVLYTGPSGAEATRMYQHIKDHLNPGTYEFATDGVVRARYVGPEETT